MGNYFKGSFYKTLILHKLFIMKIVFDLENIEDAANQFLQITKGYKIFAFSGDLGAGKTTFITSFCKQLGVEESITSPTYSIIQEYAAAHDTIVYHIDLYRIKNKEEAMEAGIEDCLNSNAICMAEWPERALAIFPEDTVFTVMEILSANQRKLVVTLPR